MQVFRNMKHRTLSSQHSTSTGRVSRVAELLLQFFTIAVAAAVVGTAGHVLQSYKGGLAAANPVWLPLWPNHFDTTGTKVLIGTGSAILFLALVYLVTSFVPKLNPKNQPKLSALSLTAVSTLSILLAISSLAVSSMLETRETDTDTLKSWTCMFSNAGAGSSIPKFMSNDDFHSLCTESKFSFWAMIPILVSQVLLLAVGVNRFFKSKHVPGTPVLGDKSSDY